MAELEIEHIDSVDIRIRCDRSIARELSDFFSFKVPNYQFHPAYRNRMWDGQIKLYNIYKQTIYAGLLKYVFQFAKDRSYEIDYKPQSKKSDHFSESNVRKYMTEFLKPFANGKIIQPHDHQVQAVTHAINHDRCLLLSPTGSGKSLIIYALMRFYFDLIPDDKKILIIVPTTSLVAQMKSDFTDYSKKNGWSVTNNCHTIFAGKEKTDSRKVIISTWQSIFKQPKSYFDQFEVVFGDECHLFKAKSLTGIMTSLTNCPYRIGTTGTLDGSQTHKLVLEGLFGPVMNVTSTKELMDLDLLSDLRIENILLEHSKSKAKAFKGMTYQDEIDWIVQNEDRNKFITQLTLRLKGNTLVLFQYIEKQGAKLYDLINIAAADGRKVFFVHGSTDSETREEIRHITEKESNAIIVASYGTFSTGISIRNLHNIVFASPSKSRIRVLQSIGRQLRKSENKDLAKLYDIGDDLSWKSYKNHTMKHFEERIKIYASEKFEYRLNRINFDEED